jgi:DNA-binding CsgD family transcriptional regulator
VPANAYNVAAQLLAVEAGADQNRAVARVHLADGLWVTLRAARLAAAGLVGQSDIAVTIEESSPADRANVFARSFGLSRRETELLTHLVTGADTRELARRMFLSEHTIQDHLKGILCQDVGAQSPDSGSTNAWELTHPLKDSQVYRISACADEHRTVEHQVAPRAAACQSVVGASRPFRSAAWLQFSRSGCSPLCQPLLRHLVR